MKDNRLTMIIYPITLSSQTPTPTTKGRRLKPRKIAQLHRKHVFITLSLSWITGKPGITETHKAKSAWKMTHLDAIVTWIKDQTSGSDQTPRRSRKKSGQKWVNSGGQFRWFFGCLQQTNNFLLNHLDEAIWVFPKIGVTPKNGW